MNYPAVTLINRTGKLVEWMCGGKIYQMTPGETRPFTDTDDRYAAHHALTNVATGLELYTQEIEDELIKQGTKKMPDYKGMSWQSLVQRVGKDFTPGMMKEECIRILEKRWEKKYGKKK